MTNSPLLRKKEFLWESRFQAGVSQAALGGPGKRDPPNSRAWLGQADFTAVVDTTARDDLSTGDQLFCLAASVTFPCCANDLFFVSSRG